MERISYVLYVLVELLLLYGIFIIFSKLITWIKLKTNIKHKCNEDATDEFEVIYQQLKLTADRNNILLYNKALILKYVYTILLSIILFIMILDKLVQYIPNIFEINAILKVISVLKVILNIKGCELLFPVVFIASIIGYTVYSSQYNNFIKLELAKLLNASFEKSDKKSLDIGSLYVDSGFCESEEQSIIICDAMEAVIWEDTALTTCYLESEKRKVELEEFLFKGIFGVFSFSNNIRGSIEILNHELYNSNKTRITFNDSEFDDLFYIYTQDEYELKKVLNEEARKVLIDLYNKYELDFEVIIKSNNIYFTIHREETLGIKFFNGLMSRKKVYYNYIVIKFIIEMLETLREILKK